MKFKSKLTEITETIFTATDFLSAQHHFITFIENTNVKDKVKMINEVKKMKNLFQLQKYTANALLKFEGLGVN